MSRIFLLTFVLIISIQLPGKAQEKLKRQKIEENISIKIPTSFILMSESDMWQRVTSYRKSIALFTDLNRMVELGINRSYAVWYGEDYKMMYDVYKSSILQLYDEVEFIKEEITTIKKQPFVVFEFISTIRADNTMNSGAINKYIYIQYTIFEGQTLVFNFSCPEFQKEMWQSAANQIMGSVILK